MADRAEPVPDDVWEEAARHYDEQALAGLVLAIAGIVIGKLRPSALAP